MSWLQQLDVHAALAAMVAVVRGFSTDGFIISMALPLLLATVFAIVAVVSRFMSRTLQQHPPVPIDSLSQGYQRVQGKASGPLLTSPLCGRPCVWWRVRIWRAEVRTVERRDLHHERERTQEAVWVEQAVRNAPEPISCTQGVAHCAVAAGGFDMVMPSEVRLWEGDQPEPQPRDAPLMKMENSLLKLPSYPSELGRYAIVLGQLRYSTPWRYAEEIILPGSPLDVMGHARQLPGDGGWIIEAAGGRSFTEPCTVSAQPLDQPQDAARSGARGAAFISLFFLVIAAALAWARWWV